MTRLIGTPRLEPWPPWGGLLILLLLLTAALGCARSRGPSPFLVSIPPITTPVTIACLRSGQPAECLLLLRHDFEELVRALKAACLANGQSAADCQTGP